MGILKQPLCVLEEFFLVYRRRGTSAKRVSENFGTGFLDRNLLRGTYI